MVRATDGVPTVEDVIVHELIAGRPRDPDDIGSMLFTEIELDEEFADTTARTWGCRHLARRPVHILRQDSGRRFARLSSFIVWCK